MLVGHSGNYAVVSVTRRDRPSARVEPVDIRFEQCATASIAPALPTLSSPLHGTSDPTHIS